MTGYKVLAHVKKFGLEVSGGTVYHQLDMLENAGIIKGTLQKRKRTNKTVYEMTEKGMKAFNDFQDK